MPTSRVIFAVFCILGIVAIIAGAGIEIVRFRRGDGLIATRQFRWRLVSAVIWIMTLATFFYAVTWLWPNGGTTPLAHAQAKRFLLVVLGALALLMVALFLLLADVWQTAYTRRLYEARAKAKFAALTREEAAKLREE